jgi:hypothetical protein
MRQIRYPAWTLALTFMATLFSSLQASNLVLNGNFDSNGTPTTSFSVQTPTPLPKWTMVTGNSNQVYDCVVPGAAGIHSGSRDLICQGNSSIGTFTLWQYPGLSPDGGNYFMADADTSFGEPLQQMISGLTSGDKYLLTFYQAAGQEDCVFDDGIACGSGTQTTDWTVSLGAGTLGTAAPLADETHVSTTMTNLTYNVNTNPNGSVTAWESQSMTFTANAATELLQFLAVGGPAGSPPMDFLDGVSLTQIVPTPEPASLVLLLLALVFLRVRYSRQALSRAATVKAPYDNDAA